jgi:hypothetical protein
MGVEEYAKCKTSRNMLDLFFSTEDVGNRYVTLQCQAHSKLQGLLAQNATLSVTIPVKQTKQTSWPLVREGTIPTERPPPVDEI